MSHKRCRARLRSGFAPCDFFIFGAPLPGRLRVPSRAAVAVLFRFTRSLFTREERGRRAARNGQGAITTAMNPEGREGHEGRGGSTLIDLTTRDVEPLRAGSRPHRFEPRPRERCKENPCTPL